MTQSAHWAVAPIIVLILWCLVPFVPLGIGLANLGESEAPYLIGVGVLLFILNVCCVVLVAVCVVVVWRLMK